MTAEVKNKFSLLSSMIDESFETAKTHSYTLILQISADGLLAAVKEKQKNRFIAFENYSFQNCYDLNNVNGLLEEIISTGKLFANSFDAVHCIAVNNTSTLVPEAVYESERKIDYLQFTSGEYLKKENTFAETVQSLDAKNVFSIPFNLTSLLDKQFNNIHYHHHSTLLIESLLRQNKNQQVKKLIIHVQASHFEILVIEGKKLLFYNTFNHHTSEDLLYYLLFVCEQLQINPEKVNLLVLGELEKNSGLFLLLQKYIRNISMGERTDTTDFSYQLQSIPTHSYFTLFNDTIQ